MPSCIVKGCNNKTGKNLSDLGIVLHGFPNNYCIIRRWLESTGQNFINIDGVIDKIIEGKKNDLFRMCSAHFTSDSYEYKGSKKMLKKTARPTIFPSVSDNKIIDEEWVLSSGKQRSHKEVRQSDIAKSSQLCGNCKKKFSDTIITAEIGTQTEEFDIEFTRHVVNPDLYNPIEVQQLDDVMQFSTPMKLPNTTASTSHSFWPPFQVSPMSVSSPILNVQRPTSSPEYLPEIDVVDENPNLCQSKNPNDCSELLPLEISTSTVQQQESSGEEYIPGDLTKNDSEMSFVQEIQDLINPHQEADIDPLKSNISMKKFIVFESCLDDLLRKVVCQHDSLCGKLVVKINKQYQGSAVIVRGVCENGHSFRIFESQPKIRRFYVGNILFSSAVICSGLNFNKLSHFCKLLGLLFFSSTTFHKYQKNYCFPAIHNAWEREKVKISNAIAGKPITLGGDGQCDSPGHSAKYCVYTFMDLLSFKITDFEVVQVTQCSSSVSMEKEGFEICMNRAIESNVDIEHFASDRHVSIRKCIRENFPHIDHQFDVWHFAKSITKKLREATKKRGCAPLKKWIDKINNHFWWSVQNCQNDVELLKRNWLSVLHHVTNEHEWTEDGITYSCSHPPLTTSENNESNWIQAGTSAYLKLCLIVNSPDILKDLKHLTWSCHTGPLEVYHSTVLKYRTKRIHFSMDSMQARTILAALSNNYNTNRTHAVIERKNTRSGELGEKRYKFYQPKRSEKWSARNVYKARNFDFVEEIFMDTMKICDGSVSSTWVSTSGSLPSNISKVPMPAKSEVLSRKRSRFGNME